MKPHRVMSVAVLALSAAVLIGGCGGSGEKWDGESIALGSLFSTTGDGVGFGPQQVKGAQLAVDEVNRDDGVNGAELTLTQRNDASDPATSAVQMKALVEQEVLAVLGPTFSNSAAEADPVANRLRTPVLAVSNTGPGIVGDCDYPCDFIFRDSLGEATAIPANVGSLTAESDLRQAAIVHAPDDPFGETTAEIARESFVDDQVKATVYQGPAGLKRALADGPDVFMITSSSGETAADYIEQVRDGGFKGPIGGGNAFNSPLAAKSAGEAGKGAQSAAAWYAGNASEENQEFIADYREKYGEAPDQFAAQAYTGVKLLAEAAEDADLTFDDVAADREALKSSLEKIREETPLGEFRFTPDHDVIQPIWIVAMDGQGGYTLVQKVNP